MPCDLYLATDISALDILAENTFAQLKTAKLGQVYKAAEKVYQCIDMGSEDEEKTYIHLTRYLLVLDYIYKMEKDERFVKLRYDTPRKYLTQCHIKLRTNLINRYKSAIKSVTPIIAVPEREIIMTAKEIDTNIFGADKYITCQQLFEAKSSSGLILIMDVRSRYQFEDSHLKEFVIINIDDSLVKPGLSAHKLGEVLPNNVKEVYDKRSTFDYIVLIDLDTSPDTYMTSKLRILYSILTEWDYNTIYKHAPYILKGGYMDFIDRYPTYSTNPNVILQHKYEELDELLDLDIIQYPDEVSLIKEDSNQLTDEINALYKDILDITDHLFKIEVQILEKQKKFYDPSNANIKNRVESEIAHITSIKIDLNDKKKCMNSKLQSLLEKSPTDDVRKKTEVHDLEKKIVNISRMSRKLIESHKIVMEEPQIPSTASATTNTMVSEGIGDIPSVKIPPPDVPKPEIPTVNRSTKPKTSHTKLENDGLVGLVNIRNTCYMNSVIQCYRYLPSVKNYFLSGRYQKEITTDNPSMIRELANLICNIWTTNMKSLCPTELYKRSVTLHPSFKRGNHEDANEFFIFVYDHIFEDTAIAVPRDKYAEVKYQTMYDRIQYKNSFFVQEFYHQIRTDCICGGCSKKCLKYDIENVIMLAVPNNEDCSIEDMFDEFMHTCDISDYYCRNCDRKGDIFREFSYQPKIISFLLKRYTYGRGVAEKITVPCEFPTDNFRIGRASYKLWAALLHQGGMEVGHYTAVCLNSEDGLWYEFNDEHVRAVNINSRIIKEKIYMLFYESEDGSEVGFSDK